MGIRPAETAGDVPRAETTRYRRVAWLVYLAAGGLVATPYWSVTPFQSKLILWPILGWSSVIAVVVGVRMHRPRAGVAWYFLAACAGVQVIGDDLFSYKNQVTHSITFPSIVDVIYLCMYPLGIIGLALLVRRRSPGRDRASMIDAAIITVALGVVSWVFLISPYVHANMA